MKSKQIKKIKKAGKAAKGKFIQNKVKSDIMFSIIMPTHNRKFCLDAAINSVLSQTYKKFELIIIDDGSTDGTKELIKKKYHNEITKGILKYFYKSNEGVCKARNYGLKNSKNEWIAYLDSDNTIRQDFLETFAKAIEENKDAKLFYAKLQYKNKGIILGRRFDREALISHNFIDIGVFIHHKEYIKKYGGFDENMSRLVDWELIVRYTNYEVPVFVDKVVLDYNDSDNYSRITNSDNYFDNLAYMRIKHCSDFEIITTMITTYNHEKYIEKAIQSAIKQEGDFIHEIIISDDASTDRTPEIIAEYAAKYPNLIKNISLQKNIGISNNMKRCFEAASGKFVAVLEGDDYWINNRKLELQKKFLDNNKDCSMVFSRVKLLNEKTQKIQLLERHDGLPEKLTGDDFIKELSLIVNFSCTMFYRKDLINLPKILYKDRLSEIALAFYLEQKGKIGFISTPLSVYRQHENGVWSGADKSKKLMAGISCVAAAVSVCQKKYFQSLEKYIMKKVEILNSIKEFSYYKFLPFSLYPTVIKEWYYRYNHNLLNLDNPRTFNEKIQWLKLYDSTPIKTRLADKYLVRDWVKEKIGEEYLVPLLGVYDKFEDIDFERLPNRFVIKCNHGSGWNIIVKDKSNFNFADAKKKIDIWMKDNYAFKFGFELHYRDIEPKIIIEKYIDEIGNSLYDYRFLCCNGKVEQIWLDIYSGTPNHKRKIYDKNWNELNIKVKWPRLEIDVPKPQNLSKMIEFAEKMSAEFALVRVDFYDINNKIYFGEMTFTSMSGTGQFEPKIEDLKLGKKIKLPKLAYNIDTGEYYELPKIKQKSELWKNLISYLLFPYYIIATRVLRKKKARLIAAQEAAKKPKQKVDKNRISIKLLKCLPVFTYKNSGGKKVWKFFGLPLFKKRTTDGGKNIKFYVFGVNVLQYSKKTTKVLR